MQSGICLQPQRGQSYNMKNLRYFTDDAITMFKANKEDFCAKMREFPNSTDWLKSFYGDEPTVPSKYSFDFEFKPFDKKSSTRDFDNAVALYELFEENNIGPATIYNEKFLTGFIFTFGYEYFMNVMGADQVTHVFATLFFDDGTHRAVARNVVGQLYRYVEMTVDDTLVDRYEITRYVFQNPALFRIKYNTLVDGENTTRAIFKAFREWTEETHKSPTTPMVEKLKVHLSVLANISETDLMDERALINYLKEFIRKVDHKLA